METEYAIQVKEVTKVYKLFDSNVARMKDALSLTRKKLYKEHYALNKLSFNVRRGEAVGIIGVLCLAELCRRCVHDPQDNHGRASAHVG